MKTAKNLVLLAMGVLFMIFMSFASYRSTDSTEIGVRTIKWLGKKGVEDKVYQPGSAYFIPPIINAWDTYDTRLHVVEMKGPRQMAIKTKDGNDIFVDVTVSYRIDPMKAPYIRQFVARNDMELSEKVLKTIARSRTRDFIGELSTDEFVNTEERNKEVDRAKEGLQSILATYGIILERIAVMDYRFDPDYLKVITEKKVAEAKTLEIRAQIEAQREGNKKMLNDVDGQVKSMIATAMGRYSNTVSSADAEYDQKKYMAEATLTEGTNAALAIIKQREAMASAGGETQIQLAIATNLMGKKLLMIPSGNAVNLQTLDLNRMLEQIIKK